MDAKSPLLPPDLISDLAGPMLIARSVKQQAPRDTPAHTHARGQLLGASAGLLTVETGAGRWLVGPEQAIWAPPNHPHSVQSHGPFVGWSLYLTPLVCERLPDKPGVLGTTVLLRALIERAAQWNPSSPLETVQVRLAEATVDEVAHLPFEALLLPTPSDPRLRRVTAILTEHPGDARSLEAWAEVACMSARSLTRLFAEDVGISLSLWRRRVRLVFAQEKLAQGGAVAQIAGDVGYDSPSAFSAAFRRAFGKSPIEYAVGLRDKGSVVGDGRRNTSAQSSAYG